MTPTAADAQRDRHRRLALIGNCLGLPAIRTLAQKLDALDHEVGSLHERARLLLCMNTKDMPFQNSDGGTWMAMLIAIGAGAICYWALRRMRAF